MFLQCLMQVSSEYCHSYIPRLSLILSTDDCLVLKANIWYEMGTRIHECSLSHFTQVMQSQMIGMQSSLDRILSAVQPQSQPNIGMSQPQQSSYSNNIESSPRREGPGYAGMSSSDDMIQCSQTIQANLVIHFLLCPDLHHRSVQDVQ